MPFSIFILLIVIVLAFVTVAAVIYIGAREDLSHEVTMANSEAVKVWEAKAASVQVAEVASAGPGTEAIATAAAEGESAEDVAARKRAEALARKAARAAKQGGTDES